MNEPSEISPATEDRFPRANQRCATGVIVAMVVVSLVSSVLLQRINGQDPKFYDPDGWGRMGLELAAGEGLLENHAPSAFRGPVVPLVFAAAVKMFGDSYRVLLVVQCIFFSLANGLLGEICWRLFGNWKVVLLSMLIYLGFTPAHPWFLNVFAEPIFMTCLASFMLSWLTALQRKSWPWSLLTGVLLGISALARPVMYFFLPVVLLYELRQRALNRRACAAVAAIVLGFLLLEVPWVVRNYRALDRVVITTTGGSQSLFLATWYQQANWMGNVFHDPERFPPAGEGFWKLPPQEQEIRWRQMAWQNWQENPVAVVMLIPKRSLMFLFQLNDHGWMPTPKSLVLAGSLYLFAFAGFWLASPDERRRYAPCLILVLFTLVFHSLLQSEYRYSHPIQPYIFMLSALGVVRTGELLLGRDRSDGALRASS